MGPGGAHAAFTSDEDLRREADSVAERAAACIGEGDRATTITLYLEVLPDPGYTAASFSPDEARVISAGYNNTMRLWRADVISERGHESGVWGASSARMGGGWSARAGTGRCGFGMSSPASTR